MGGRGAEYFQKEGAELGSKAGRERDSRNISASWGKPMGPTVPSQRPYTMKDQLHVGTGLWVRQTWTSLFHLPLALGRPSTSLSITGLIWKMGAVTVSMSPGGHEDEMRTQRELRLAPRQVRTEWKWALRFTWLQDSPGSALRWPHTLHLQKWGNPDAAYGTKGKQTPHKPAGRRKWSQTLRHSTGPGFVKMDKESRVYRAQ